MNKSSTTPALISVLFAIALALAPVTGHCDWISSVSERLGLKGNGMDDVATKVATLSEDEDIRGMGFSPDGKYLASTSPNTKLVHIWDWQGGERVVQRLEKKGSDLTTTEPITYSPDGRLLVWCGGTITRIWNTDTWELIHTIDSTNGIEAAGGGCESIAFTPDGKLLILVLERVANRPGDNLTIYDTSTWQPVWGLRTVPLYPKTLAISPDSKFLAMNGAVIKGITVPSELQIALVDISQRAVIRTINNRRGTLGRLAWSPDGIHLATGGGAGVEIYDVRTGELVLNEASGGGHVLIRYTPDGKYFIESGFGKDVDKVRIWDGQHRQLLQEMSAKPGSMAVSRDGHYLAMGGNKKIIIWQLK